MANVRAVQLSQTVQAASQPPRTVASTGNYPTGMIQRLIDQAAIFNVYALPDAHRGESSIYASNTAKDVIGIRVNEVLHSFDIDLQLPDAATGVKAVNVVGRPVGRLDLRWMVIPYAFKAHPDREPPPTRLDRTRSQRFAMQEGTFTFGDGTDGFHSFGTGRTFPMMVGGRPTLLVAAVGNITAGFGKFSGHEGNYTLCGDLTSEHEFVGHIVVRVMDQEGRLLTLTHFPAHEAGAAPAPSMTFLAWVGQKGQGAEQENRFSFTPDGQPRGLNIATELKHARVGFTVHGSEGFQSSDLRTGKVIGGEKGFGPIPPPGVPTTGTGLNPFSFGGVAHYTLHDAGGETVGAFTTNVLEGRRFDMTLVGAPGEPAFRFGFFGPILSGIGRFSNVEGIFYGASGSVLRPPPGDHVVTHYYVARINDPDGKFRAAVNKAQG